jgi:DNA-binding LytR/AlgR family response regulator
MQRLRAVVVDDEPLARARLRRLLAQHAGVEVVVNTPHPLSEAFRAGERAYLRGDYRQMLNFMQQAEKVEPNSPDLL